MWLDNQSRPVLQESTSVSLYKGPVSQQKNLVTSLPENEVCLTTVKETNMANPENIPTNASAVVDYSTVPQSVLGQVSPEHVCTTIQPLFDSAKEDLTKPQNSNLSEYSTLVTKLLTSGEEVAMFVRILCSSDLCDSVCSSSVTFFLSLMKLYQCERLDVIDGADQEAVFPIDIVNHYIDGIQTENNHTESYYSRTLGICPKKKLLLNVISAWLGKEFSALQPAIMLKVDTFKKEHIECIDNLPPPKGLVSELFPESMVTLLEHWMSRQQVKVVTMIVRAKN